MKILNKKALHNYFVIESLEAGIKLLGPEVKSIREGRIDLGEAHIRILNNEAVLLNANIPLYQNAKLESYNPTRSRKLLLHRSQIESLVGKISRGGLTLVPISIYDKHNLLKIQLGLVKSKREIDKRQVIKERDHQRRIEQELRGKE